MNNAKTTLDTPLVICYYVTNMNYEGCTHMPEAYSHITPTEDITLWMLDKKEAKQEIDWLAQLMREIDYPEAE